MYFFSFSRLRNLVGGKSIMEFTATIWGNNSRVIMSRPNAIAGAHLIMYLNTLNHVFKVVLNTLYFNHLLLLLQPL